MATTPQSRSERIDIRVNKEAKSLIAQAAELSGQNLSVFVLEAVRERALRTIAEHDRVVLNNRARGVFLKALASPPAPNAALRKAAAKHALK